MRDVVGMLHRVPYLSDLPEARLRAIAGSGTVRRFAAGATLFRESAPCAGAFVLLTGEVRLRKVGPAGREQIMAVLRPVAICNAVAVLDNGPNTATATAVGECLAWHVSRQGFQSVTRAYPELGLKLLPVLAARNRHLVAQYEDLSFRPVLGRVAHLLLDLSGNGRYPIDRQEHSVVEIAARTATVPEAVSRSLGSLKRRGLIACTRKRIAVLVPQALAALAHVDPPVIWA